MKLMGHIGRIGLIVWAVLLCVGIALAEAESKYARGTTSAAVTFGPGQGRTTVKSVNAISDLEDGEVQFWARGTAGKKAPSHTTALSGTGIGIANSNYGSASPCFSNGDHVAYVHANGTVDKTTVSTASLTNVVLAAGLSVAGATGDYLYELTQQGAIVAGFEGAGAGTNDNLNVTDCFVTPGDSPLYVLVTGTATSMVLVTVDK